MKCEITISELPTIIDVLHHGGAPAFAVLPYYQFVRLAAMSASPDDSDASPNETPEVSSVLEGDGEHAYAIVAWDAYRSYLNRFAVFGHVDENHYLTMHEDVRKAVEDGGIASGTEHYIVQGYFERRRARLINCGESS